jgi:type IX secretion system PorP/SprF family membrane protein
MRNNHIIFVCLLLVILGGTGHVQAQQRPIQSLYMFDQLLINPAYAGAHVQLSATSIYRNQWVNFEGAPKTATATVHSGFFNSKVGVGVIVGRDQIGIHDDFNLYFAYSYKIKMANRGVLSMGIQGGFNNISSDFELLNRKYDGDPQMTGRNIKFAPNFGTGLFYSQGTFYAGAAAPYLINNEILTFEGVPSLAQQRRYYYFHGGKTFSMGPHVKLIPSTLVRFQEGAPLSFDINGNVVFHDTVGIGCSYRLGDSVIAMFELKINENFHVGYGYDVTTSDIRRYSQGSHEIMLNYRVRINRIHKGLECPSYF